MSNRVFSANVQYNGEWIRNDDTWEYEPGASSYIDVPPNTTYAKLLDKLYDELEVDRCSYDLVVKVMFKSATKRNIPSVIKKDKDVKLFVEENRISKQERIGYIPLCISTVQKASANLSVVQKTFDPVISQRQDLNVLQKERDKPLDVHESETRGDTGANKLTWKSGSVPLDSEKERAQDLHCKNLRLPWGPSQQPLAQNPFKAWTTTSPFTSFNPQQHQNQPHINNPWRPKPGSFLNEGAKVRPQINQARVCVAETGPSSGVREGLMVENLNDKRKKKKRTDKRKKRIDTSGSSEKEAEKKNPMEEGDLQNGGSLKESKKINESSSAIENGAQETETPGAQPTMKRMKSSPVKRIDTSGSSEKEAEKTNPMEEGDLQNGGSLKESTKINEGSSAMENGAQETKSPGAQPTTKRMKSSPVNSPEIPMPLELDSVENSNSSKEIPEVYVLPKPEFCNFDGEKSEDKFLSGQLWAIYGNEDRLPRYYALVKQVNRQPNFKISVHLLTLGLSNIIRYAEKRMPISCGVFKYISFVEATSYTNTTPFSHRLKVEPFSQINDFEIYPRKGEVWAVYKNWNVKMSPSDLLKCEYDLVEVLEGSKLVTRVVTLERISGFSLVFKACRNEGSLVVREILQSELLKFSHQIPAFRLTNERGGTLKGCLELDPAALPIKMFQTR